MTDSSRPDLSFLTRKRIKALHDEKQRINTEKLKHTDGYYNVDDHGYIYFEDFKFEPITHEDGMIYGCDLIGKNLRKFLNAIPPYMEPDSALCGCWVGFFQNFAPIGLAPKDRPVHLSPIHEKYGMYPGIGAMNHLGPDMRIGLELGFNGLLEKVRFYRRLNEPADTSFYDGEEELLLGILEYIRNHVAYLEEKAAGTDNETERGNFEAVLQMNRNLLKQPPRTFREACQFLAHFQSVDRTYYGGGALDRLDVLLKPYYEKDKADGILTDDEAVWYIASLFYNDTHYSQIGGLTPDGSRDTANRVSFLILEAMHWLHIPVNIALRVHPGMNEELLKRSIEYTLADGSGVSYSLSKGIEEGFMKNGHTIEIARMRAKVGCNWVALPGIEYSLQDVTRVNFAWIFVHAFNELVENDGEPTMEKLYDRFHAHLAVNVNCIKDGYDWHYEVVSRNTPEIVLNLFCHGPVERGLNSAQGGVDIMGMNCDGIALATVADSFAAVERRVVLEHRLTWKELLDILKCNYEDHEDVRQMMKNIDRFGSPGSRAEKWAIRIRDDFVNLVTESATPRHNIRVIPGLFSHGEIYTYAKGLPATPNGRKFEDPISHSSEPDPGFARGVHSFSPSLKANAVAVTQAGYGNSAPLHLDIDTNMVKNAGGIEALAALIHTHEQMGGTLINLNCVSKEDLLEAHEDPNSHPDLVVRVTGYSAFFASLSKEYRQQIVDRYLS